MLKIRFDTAAAHQALDELIAKAELAKVERVRTEAAPAAGDKLDPAKVAQAQKRYERRNGIR